jgi:hypothetical protein
MEFSFFSLVGFIGLFDTARDYTSQLTVTHTNVHSHVFTSRCLVAAFKRGRSPSPGLFLATTITEPPYNISATDRVENTVSLL